MTEALMSLRDEGYKSFQEKLIPTVPAERIIGVRTPMLRKLAKTVPESVLASLPHYYYEENCLHAFAIERIKDIDECIEALDRFLPFVDNWATCDSMSPPVLKKRPEKVLPKIKEWIKSDKTYTVRYGIKTLMNVFSDGLFKPEYLSWVSSVRSDEYYIVTMQAWYFATLLAKQWDAALPYIEKRVLPKEAHNRAIQKARESFRVSVDRKEYLKSLKY